MYLLLAYIFRNGMKMRTTNNKINMLALLAYGELALFFCKVVSYKLYNQLCMMVTK